MEPIRVLCVFSTLDRGGAESMCMNLYRNIDRTRVQFDFVKHTQNKGAFEDEIISLGGNIFEAPRCSIKNYFSYKAWWKNFFSEHPEHKIVHGHFFTISSIYLKIAHDMGRYTIGHIHASSEGDGIKGKMKTWYIHNIEKVADTCFACSEEAGKWAYRKAKYTVLKNAIDSSKFAFDQERRAFMRKSLGISDDKKVILVVANLSEVKNPLGTLNIYKTIHEKLPMTCLLWAGEGGMRSVMETKIKDDNITGVTLLGTRSDVPALMQAADAFMLCSFSEGLPVVTIEAQAAGLPCLLSNAVTREATITKLCSFLPIDRPEAWAETIFKCNFRNRENKQDEIKKSGYDIKETSKWIEAFYLHCAEGEKCLF